MKLLERILGAKEVIEFKDPANLIKIISRDYVNGGREIYINFSYNSDRYSAIYYRLTGAVRFHHTRGIHYSDLTDITLEISKAAKLPRYTN
jgi:adenine-specific DNA methylase